MLGRDYPGENCSIARALELVGERWTLLILRDALFRGMVRYSDFQRSLDIASNVLAARLERMVEEGLLDLGTEGEYRPTPKAYDMVPVLVALTQWGDRWAAPQGPPIVYRTPSGASIHIELRTDRGRSISPTAAILAEPGPGSH